MTSPRYPSLLQLQTRPYLRELADRLARPVTLADVPDEVLDRVAELGFDWVWPLGVWQTGPAGRAVSLANPAWRPEFQALLPDLTDADVTGSPFAVRAYAVHADLGGNDALARLRERLGARGLRLLLDFVPNHTAPDHPWVREHPEYYVPGTDADLAGEPYNWTRVETGRGTAVLAYGRDPYFHGWPDTLQLNYRSRAVRAAMTGELLTVAGLCDGVRCDMAMLLLPEVFRRTWGDRALPADGSPPADAPFWPQAIDRVHATHPDFVFMAEVYWDLEWQLQQQGFDYTYDKRLYDRLVARDAPAVRGHLRADPDFQRKSVRFLENHDEPRAAAVFPDEVHRAAAVITFLVPGLRFFHEGQFDGRRKRLPVHLGRRPAETPDAGLREFYGRLLEVVKGPAARGGSWRILDVRPAWHDNATWQHFVAFAWDGPGSERLVVAVNYAGAPGQCYVDFPFPGLRGGRFVLRDRLGPAVYERNGTALADAAPLAGYGLSGFGSGPGRRMIRPLGPSTRKPMGPASFFVRPRKAKHISLVVSSPTKTRAGGSRGLAGFFALLS
jgi:glycosidase